MNSPYKNRLTRTKLDKIMSQEQFDQVVEAILAGKYSWACVLILRFAGYNPLHYIPYRTYNRLIKDNCKGGGLRKHKTHPISTDQEQSDIQTESASSIKRPSQISDLSYLETVNIPPQEVQGGATELLTDLHPLIRDLTPDNHQQRPFNSELDRLLPFA